MKSEPAQRLKWREKKKYWQNQTAEGWKKNQNKTFICTCMKILSGHIICSVVLFINLFTMREIFVISIVIWLSGWFLFIFHGILSGMHEWIVFWFDDVGASVCVRVGGVVCGRKLGVVIKKKQNSHHLVVML